MLGMCKTTISTKPPIPHLTGPICYATLQNVTVVFRPGSGSVAPAAWAKKAKNLAKKG